MSADAFIQYLVTPEIKAALRSAYQLQLMNELAVLNRLIDFSVSGVERSPDTAPVPPATRGGRLSIRLRPDHQFLLQERATARGMPAATYASVLIRAYLRSISPLPKEELLALERLTAEL